MMIVNHVLWFYLLKSTQQFLFALRLFHKEISPAFYGVDSLIGFCIE